ncbi:arginase family protein [Pseudomonas protegens]|uniref:arginase family protein n=1 Tax=Pseudomonas protegens TaxID=380021 RepID=UPI001C8EF128|nr:arginase family protein [Pseudomonas protegens]
MPRDRYGPGKGPQQVFLGGVPFDTTTSRCGARFGPRGIRGHCLSRLTSLLTLTVRRL